jgi:hypothetical protein
MVYFTYLSNMEPKQGCDSTCKNNDNHIGDSLGNHSLSPHQVNLFLVLFELSVYLLVAFQGSLNLLFIGLYRA